MQTIAIIDYGSGNLRSVRQAFERVVADAGAEIRLTVTDDANAVRGADRIVLPGVGAFANCRAGLDAVPGMVETLRETVIERARPFLGICVGMQLMATRGLEKTTAEGLDWIPGDVRRIEPSDAGLKIPQIGWNTLETGGETGAGAPHPLLAGLPTGPHGLHAYFVHSYHLVADRADDVAARVDYGGPLTAMVARDNYAGTQFHPEKSQQLGLGILANFLTWKP